MAPPSWEEKLKNLEKFWSGRKEKDDVTFVKERLKQWVPQHHKLVEVLDLFTFGEFKSFLEHIRKRDSLRLAIKNMAEQEFSKNVREWGDNYIALRAQKSKENPRGDISLRDEFEEDKRASREQ